jgi:alkylation response protein AidB-like acyl-CoA dehydrogenase
MTIELRPTELQAEILGTFGSIFAKEASIERVRAAEPMGHDASAWRRLCALGCLEVAGPGAAESASSLPETTALAGLVGRHVAPVPFLESVAVARLLAAAQHPALPDVLRGERVITFAPRTLGSGPQVVPAGAVADGVLVIRDGAVLLVTRTPDRAAWAANLGSSPVAVLDLDSERGDVVAADGEIWRRLLQDWRLHLAAALAELASRALEIGAEQARSRKQFGAPIGAYQAVSHRLADLATMVDAARLMVAKAAWARELGRGDAPVLGEMAWVQATRTSEDASSATVHFLGGYGITEEYDAQLYFRRAKAWALLGGGRRAGIDRLAVGLLG